MFNFVFLVDEIVFVRRSCVDADCRAALCALADTFALHTISQDILFRCGLPLVRLWLECLRELTVCIPCCVD